MEKSIKVRILFRRVIAVVASAAVFAFLCVLFSGCSADVDVRLLRSEIELAVGESRDIMPYIRFTPATAQNIPVAFIADSDCVEIKNTVVTAKKQGAAVIAVETYGKTESFTVSITERRCDLDISVDGALVQTVDSVASASDVKFVAKLADGGDLFGDSVIWTVGNIIERGNAFTYTPSAYGEFDVCATFGDVTVKRTVRIYRPTAVSVKTEGFLSQSDDFSPVRFYAIENVDSRNPQSCFEWYVNGNYFGGSRTFEFVPQNAGESKISLRVNGKDVDINGSQFVSVCVSGTRAPVGKVDFDDRGGVYVKWSDGRGIYYISIISPDGIRRNFDCTDAQYGYLFSDGEFRATEFINVCSENPGNYTIIIGADGCSESTFRQYPMLAKNYLDMKILCRNGFISSEADAWLFVRELYACGISSSRAYIARDAGDVESALRESANSVSATIRLRREGDVVFIELAGLVNAPTRIESANGGGIYTSVPHVEYSAANRRGGGYTLMLDRSKTTVDVSGSEQLVYVAECGIRPVVRAGSAAEKIYRSARNILLNIIGKDYSDREKVHAVYDWLQWVITRSETADKSACSAYTESIFGSNILSFPDDRRIAPVTSAGAAKAMSLLCNMEGIKCVAVFSNGYWYNKVNIDGVWYISDVLLGKISVSDSALAIGSELNSHCGLLINDTAAEKYGLDAVDDNRAAIDGMNFYMQKRIIDGEYCDYYIDVQEVDDYKNIKNAVYAAFDDCIRGRDNIMHNGIMLVGRIEFPTVVTIGFELEIGTDDIEVVSAVTADIMRAADEYAVYKFGAHFAKSSIHIYSAGGIIHFVAAVPKAI